MLASKVRSAHPRFSGAARSRGRVRRDVRRLYARNNPRPRPRAPGARAARKYYRMCSRGSCPSRGRASPYRAPGSPRRTRSWSRGVTDASRTTRSAGGGASELVRGASAGPRSAARRLLSGGGDAAARRRAPLPGRERGRSRPGYLYYRASYLPLLYEQVAGKRHGPPRPTRRRRRLLRGRRGRKYPPRYEPCVARRRLAPLRAVDLHPSYRVPLARGAGRAPRPRSLSVKHQS